MKENQLISVIVPVYNVEKYLDECIESIVNQSYTNLEIILVDDGSTDNSGEKCDIWATKDNRIIVIHKSNGGLGNARNVGMSYANGEWIGFVDSDDFIEPEMYEVLYRGCIENEADLSMVGLAIYENGLKKQLKMHSGNVIIYEDKQWMKEYYEKNKSGNIIPSACSKLYKKYLLEGKLFPENRYYEDLLISTSVMLDANRIAYIDVPCYNYRCDRKDSITKRKLTIKHVKDSFDMQQKEIQLLRERGYVDWACTLTKGMLLNLSNQIGIYTFKCLVPREAMKYLKQQEKCLWQDVRKLVKEESLGQRLLFSFAHHMKLFYALGLKCLRIVRKYK